ncbi:polymerase-associated protein [Obodhiang virus]|uniref:Polymerase-associated protein n=1 Tax=Obodhiang virus TaxID=380160 RepID=H8XWS6_9RHAB|nr:polymerase-associated protein [Obodhiang virus]AEI17642.1 polymerase-associated protein [Obodhiang virus]
MEKFNPEKILGNYNTQKLIESINETNWNLDEDLDSSICQVGPAETVNEIDNYKDEVIKIGVCLSSYKETEMSLDNQKEKEIYLDDDDDWEAEFSNKIEDRNLINNSELEIQINVEDLIALMDFLKIEIDQYNILPLTLQNKIIIQKKEGMNSTIKTGDTMVNQSKSLTSSDRDTDSKTNRLLSQNESPCHDTHPGEGNTDVSPESKKLFQYLIKIFDDGVRVKKKFSSKKIKITKENIGLDYHVIAKYVEGKNDKDSMDIEKIVKELIKKGKKYRQYSNQLDLSMIDL